MKVKCHKKYFVQSLCWKPVFICSLSKITFPPPCGNPHRSLLCTMGERQNRTKQMVKPRKKI